MHRTKLTTLAALCFQIIWTSNNVHAKQTKNVVDGCEVEVEIASHDLTRIKINSDRISSVKLNHGELELLEDPKVGDIFIKPTSRKKSPISIFITSERGRTYKLLLKPSKAQAEQVFLVDTGINQDSITEKATGYENSIVHLIRLLREREVDDGGGITSFEEDLISGDQNFVLKDRIYKFGYVGEILEYTNRSDTEVAIDPIFLLNEMKGDWLALSLDKKAVSTNGSTFIYVIRGGESE